MAKGVKGGNRFLQQRGHYVASPLKSNAATASPAVRRRRPTSPACDELPAAAASDRCPDAACRSSTDSPPRKTPHTANVYVRARCGNYRKERSSEASQFTISRDSEYADLS